MLPLEVLIVDDNPGDLRLIEECVRSSHTPLNVSLSSDGEEALELLDRTQPDLILLDLRLPKLDGHEVLRRMKVHDYRPVIVIMSSSRNPDDIDRAFEAGASDYMPKPSDLEDFRKAVDGVLRTWIEPILRSK